MALKTGSDAGLFLLNSACTITKVSQNICFSKIILYFGRVRHSFNILKYRESILDGLRGFSLDPLKLSQDF